MNGIRENIMEYIRDKNGNVISSSRNLAGIRRYVSNHLIKKLDMTQIGDNLSDGQLSILFDDGSSFQTSFFSFSVLFDFVQRWRNVYGANYSVNGIDCGVLSSTNHIVE